MARLNLNTEILNSLVLGGSFYGGGGGGSPEAGREAGLLALEMGHPYLADLDDLPDEALLLTVSAVGAPAGTGPHALPKDYVRAVELFQRYAGKQVSGFIANECGGLATVNGWVQSAATGLPVVDAPCNGRAHPTGAMGSMGLHRVTGYVSEQVAVGGSREQGTYLEIFIQGSIESASSLVRRTASQTGGLVAVARNSVEVSYARRNAAPGAIGRCLTVGRAILAARRNSRRPIVHVAAQASGGAIACQGRVIRKDLQTKGGFDLGRVLVEDRSGKNVIELAFCNEYVTVEVESTGRRLATFPDLITTLDAGTGLPVSSAGILPQQEVAVVVVPRASLILGAGVKDSGLFGEVERATGKELVRYAF